MALTSVGVYEFNAKDLIGHGAFAVVYRGRQKLVSNLNSTLKHLPKTGLTMFVLLNQSLMAIFTADQFMSNCGFALMTGSILRIGEGEGRGYI